MTDTSQTVMGSGARTAWTLLEDPSQLQWRGSTSSTLTLILKLEEDLQQKKLNIELLFGKI